MRWWCWEILSRCLSLQTFEVGKSFLFSRGNSARKLVLIKTKAFQCWSSINYAKFRFRLRQTSLINMKIFAFPLLFWRRTLRECSTVRGEGGGGPFAVPSWGNLKWFTRVNKKCDNKLKARSWSLISRYHNKREGKSDTETLPLLIYLGEAKFVQ